MHTQTCSSARHSSFLLCLFLVTLVCHGTDTITAKSPLLWNQTIVSATGIFEQGFFQPGSSSNYYIGLWYKQVLDRTILWVANRETPIHISELHLFELRISHGNLVLVTNGRSNKPTWSTNLDSISSSEHVEAVILDTGNLVLRNGPNSSYIMWQSSDYPAHVWLPGYKIGIDKRATTNRVLTSWKNSEDPAPGLFTFQVELEGTIEYVIYWNRTQRYWSSGAWDPRDQSFSLLPELRNKPRNSYHFRFVNNENETYFTYYKHAHSFPPMLVMDISGQLKSEVWWPDNIQKGVLQLAFPDQQCDVYHHCGAFGTCSQKSLPYCNCLHGFQPKVSSDWHLNDYSSGCSRSMKLQCENSTSATADKFWLSYNTILPEHPQYVQVGSIEDCELVCLKNCSCTAYAYDSNMCSIWIEDLLNDNQASDGDPNGKILYVRLNALEFETGSHKRRHRRLIGIIAGSVAACISILGLLICLIKWRCEGLSAGFVAADGSLMRFQYNQLQSITKNFSEKLGGGSFGSVFKGTLLDSSNVAVKKLEGAGQGEKQFRAEVSSIGKIHHVNLVRFHGFCSEGTKRLLVYEFMPNGSLNAHLFPGKDSTILNWQTRYKIALGTAKGFAYLHEKCRDCIIHCDIKPENILLDAELSPKIADFGLAKLFGREFSRVLTTLRGTRGYLAPEWLSGTVITVKADVYSFGMMLFELISGRRNTEELADEVFDFLPTLAIRIMNNGDDILSILDQRLERNADRDEVLKLCKVASWCIQDTEDQRPAMTQVVQILEGVLDVSMPPLPRSLEIFDGSRNETNFFAEAVVSEASCYASAAASMANSASSYVTAKSQQ